jgi:hypothetical protein
MALAFDDTLSVVLIEIYHNFFRVDRTLEAYLQCHALLSARTTTRSALHLDTLRGVSGAIWLQ